MCSTFNRLIGRLWYEAGIESIIFIYDHLSISKV